MEHRLKQDCGFVPTSEHAKIGFPQRKITAEPAMLVVRSASQYIDINLLKQTRRMQMSTMLLHMEAPTVRNAEPSISANNNGAPQSNDTQPNEL